MAAVGPFLASLGDGVVIPVAAAIITGVWKLLGKKEWVPEDFLIAFEMMISAIVVQMTFIGADLVSAASPPKAQPTHLGEAIWIRLGLLSFVAVILLPVFALGMRLYTEQYLLTREVSLRLSVYAAGVLGMIFLSNYFLHSIL